jgi:hypothetical protein
VTLRQGVYPVIATPSACRAGEFALQVVDLEGQDPPGRVIIALTPRPEGALDDEQWWAANAPVLAGVLDPGAYPLAVGVGTAAGSAHSAAYSPVYAYEFGLRVIPRRVRRAHRRPWPAGALSDSLLTMPIKNDCAAGLAGPAAQSSLTGRRSGRTDRSWPAGSVRVPASQAPSRWAVRGAAT